MKRYKDKDWLINEYIHNGKSTIQIAEKLDVSDETIGRWLRKFNITTGIHTHNKINLNQSLIEILDGELLGDGHLYKIKHNGIITSVRYTHGTQYREYLIWLSNKFTRLGLEQSGNIIKREHYIPTSVKLCTDYHYTSKSYPELIELYQKWYPEGKKIVPRDLKLTSTIIMHWYIGDGSYNALKSSLEFATCAFSGDDISTLIDELFRLNIKACERNNRIFIKAESFLDFFDYMGECPDEIKSIYGYKWPTERQTNKLIKIRNKSEFAERTYKDRYWLYNQYINKSMSILDIERRYGVKHSTIHNYLKKLNIPTRTAIEAKKLYYLRR